MLYLFIISNVSSCSFGAVFVLLSRFLSVIFIVATTDTWPLPQSAPGMDLRDVNAFRKLS